MMLCYRRSAKRAMKAQLKQQVESAVNQYKALSTSDKEAEARAEMKQIPNIK